MIRNVGKISEPSKDKMKSRVTEAKVDFKSEDIPLVQTLKIVGNDGDVQAHLRHAERDARVNYHRMFPLPEPEPMEELEEFEENGSTPHEGGKIT